MLQLGPSLAFSLEGCCFHGANSHVHGRMKLTESRFFGSFVWLCEMLSFVDGGFQVARGDPSTKACIFRPPLVLSVLCFPPLPLCLGRALCFLAACGRCPFLLLCSTRFRFYFIKRASSQEMVMMACKAFQIWILGLNKNIAYLAKALPASVKVLFIPSSSLTCKRRILSHGPPRHRYAIT